MLTIESKTVIAIPLKDIQNPNYGDVAQCCYCNDIIMYQFDCWMSTGRYGSNIDRCFNDNGTSYYHEPLEVD